MSADRYRAVRSCNITNEYLHSVIFLSYIRNDVFTFHYCYSRYMDTKLLCARGKDFIKIPRTVNLKCMPKIQKLFLIISISVVNLYHDVLSGCMLLFYFPHEMETFVGMIQLLIYVYHIYCVKSWCNCFVVSVELVHQNLYTGWWQYKHANSDH